MNPDSRPEPKRSCVTELLQHNAGVAVLTGSRMLSPIQLDQSRCALGKLIRLALR